jgi:peptide-methionine (S)-S-oxide reductase
MEKRMTVCAIPGANLTVKPGEFPYPEFDIEAQGRQEAVLAGGCFWCTEAVYRELAGVSEVAPGYAGGDRDSADYRKVCSGTTGHAEAIRIIYDADQLSFGTLLRVFFSVAHDPTQLNRQGNDVGPQYRSAIFVQNPEQAEVARRYIEQLYTAKVFQGSIVTTLEEAEFFPAESYHHDYAAQNPSQPYIAAVAAPKVRKVRERFQTLLRKT